MLRLGALVSPALARDYVYGIVGNVDVLPQPDGEAQHQRPGLCISQISPGQAVVAFAEGLPVAARRRPGCCAGPPREQRWVTAGVSNPPEMSRQEDRIDNGRS